MHVDNGKVGMVVKSKLPYECELIFEGNSVRLIAQSRLVTEKQRLTGADWGQLCPMQEVIELRTMYEDKTLRRLITTFLKSQNRNDWWAVKCHFRENHRFRMPMMYEEEEK
ncbi:MAG: hypothetical protein DRN14_00040 [Thermoplasmata archaeon]|nr:MAG: hypothetical protein DRN14_00040 [Thermoplasmata archaeon]